MEDYILLSCYWLKNLSHFFDPLITNCRKFELISNFHETYKIILTWLEQVPILFSIDRNAFAGIEDFVTEIYVKEPKLQKLPADSIDFLRRLSVFSVENSQGLYSMMSWH